jgi:hypothetical protein
MTVDEMVAKAEANLREFMPLVGMVICKVKKGISFEDAMKARQIAGWISQKMLHTDDFINSAIEVIREHSVIPESCQTIEGMCHSMAHILADACNDHLSPPPGSEFDCHCFMFGPPPPAGVLAALGRGEDIPPHERITFSHN